MMSDPKNTRYVVVHPKLYMIYGGVTQCPKVGTILKNLSESQVERMGKKITPYVAAEELIIKTEAEAPKK